jgi:hypothetical protein
VSFYLVGVGKMVYFRCVVYVSRGFIEILRKVELH